MAASVGPCLSARPSYRPTRQLQIADPKYFLPLQFAILVADDAGHMGSIPCS